MTKLIFDISAAENDIFLSRGGRIFLHLLECKKFLKRALFSIFGFELNNKISSIFIRRV